MIVCASSSAVLLALQFVLPKVYCNLTRPLGPNMKNNYFKGRNFRGKKFSRLARYREIFAFRGNLISRFVNKIIFRGNLISRFVNKIFRGDLILRFSNFLFPKVKQINKFIE